MVHLLLDNPANTNGTLDTVEIYGYSTYNLTGVRVGTHYEIDDLWSTRDYEDLGTITSGSKSTSTGLSIEVETGDLLVEYTTGGHFECSYDGPGVGYLDVGNMPQTNKTFTVPSYMREYAVSLYATGTEGGGDPEGTNTPITKDYGILDTSATSSTAINFFTLENTGSGAIDVEISGTDLTGGDDTWTLSDTATVGENTYGLKAGLDDDDDTFDIVVKKNASFNALVENLAESGTQDWGLQILMPTSVTNYDGQQMSGTVTLTVSAH
jgi:hypothetical protein